MPIFSHFFIIIATFDVGTIICTIFVVGMCDKSNHVDIHQCYKLWRLYSNMDISGFS